MTSYRPPLLDTGGRNPAERVADFFAYSWLYSKALWLENTRRPEASEAAAFSAAWFRPSLLASRLGCDLSDPLALAGEYEKRGLNGHAGRLLQLAAARTRDPGRLAEIISTAAALEDWERLLAVRDAVAARFFPAAANGDYWRGRALLELGRPEEAVPHLSRAAASDLADASYRLFLALRAAGKGDEAGRSLLAAIAAAPDHAAAEAAAADLLRASGKAGEGEDRRRRAESLTPAFPVRAVFGAIRLLGFDPPAPRLRGEETLRCRMYYEIIADFPEALTARLALERENRPGAVRETALPPGRFDPGVVRTALWEFPLPPEIVPGSYRLRVGLERSGQSLRRLGSREEVVSCGETVVLPGVFPVPYADRHLAELFGTDLENLRLSSVLNGRDRVVIPLSSARPRSGVGIVSYTQWSASVPQGTPVAEITVETAEGETHRFPIAAGVETADIWLADRSPEERAHGPAPLYRSRAVERGGKQATANAYYYVFRLPRPARLTAAAVEYVHPSAGALFIQNLFLL